LWPIAYWDELTPAGGFAATCSTLAVPVARGAGKLERTAVGGLVRRLELRPLPAWGGALFLWNTGASFGDVLRYSTSDERLPLQLSDQRKVGLLQFR